MNKKILIIAGGKKDKLEAFAEPAKRLSVDVTLASFSELSYASDKKEFVLKIDGEDASKFDVIYFRLVGRRLEEATLLASYANKKDIRLVDSVYEGAHLMPSSISKAVETAKLIAAGVPLPLTFYGNLGEVFKFGVKKLGYPYVIKSTSGRKAREVWMVSDIEGEKILEEKLRTLESQGMHFFAQEYIPATQRVRAFVLGGRILGAITRPTKWRKLVDSECEGVKAKYELSDEEKVISLEAARAVNLEIAGVDLIKDKVGKTYVLEVNAAPSWRALAKDVGINVEEEILKYIVYGV
jgi:RimK family alpha-L-glutamate ligase